MHEKQAGSAEPSHEKKTSATSEQRAGYAAGVVGISLALAGAVTAVLGLVAPWWVVLLSTAASLVFFCLFFLLFGRSLLSRYYELEERFSRDGSEASERGARGVLLSRPRRLALTAIAFTATVGLISGLALVAQQDPDDDKQDAADIVTELVRPLADNPPRDFEVLDRSNRPGVEGAPGDPFVFGPLDTGDCLSDVPISSANNTILASTGVSLRERGVEASDGRYGERILVRADYLSDPTRPIVAEMRSRIDVCTRQVPAPARMSAIRLSGLTLALADESAGYIANLKPVAEFPSFPVQVGLCEYARAEAVLLSVCRIGNLIATSNSLPTSNDQALRADAAELFRVLLARADDLQ
ncbi:hypothetical protein Acsp06_63060 [Actinomycetospora sp. NBRC 106375]|uniref:hypothetical protein n=1 Tax=Actinomycetospora sp. NBRC 106375 TaxID=3032207 RepID=UPI0024A19744|nr:hypothetical protein [Actinomycetospora sp. NBRC 106375]GLZ50121.1 hypothetical protein Acsp06_63060 [Actinomycetospora sp. NBRC 106375]